MDAIDRDNPYAREHCEIAPFMEWKGQLLGEKFKFCKPFSEHVPSFIYSFKYIQSVCYLPTLSLALYIHQ